MKLCTWLVSALLVLYFLQSSSAAATLLFSGGNVFPSDAAVSSFTAPGAGWSFSFTVDNLPSALLATDAGFDVIFSNFIYSVNGAIVSDTPQIRFFDSGYGGMLDIDFVSGADADMDPVTGISLAGPSMFSGSTSAPTLLEGSYTASSGTFWVGSSAVQPLYGTVVSAVDTAQVPEPDTLFGLLAAGVCFIASGIMRRISNRKS